MYVKPAPGLVIRDPDLYDLLPETGRDVPATDYWHRRLRDGDIVEAVAPVPVETARQVAAMTEPTGE